MESGDLLGSVSAWEETTNPLLSNPQTNSDLLTPTLPGTETVAGEEIVPLLAETPPSVEGTIQQQPISELLIDSTPSANNNADPLTGETANLLVGTRSADSLLARTSATDNTPPVFTSTPSEQIAFWFTYSYEITATDADGDPISYSLLTDLPRGASFDPETRVLEWVPNFSHLGFHSIVLQADDGKGGTALQAYVLEVTVPTNDDPPLHNIFFPEPDPNEPPEFTTTPPEQVILGEEYTYDAQAIDADEDPLTYSLLVAPENAQIDRNSGVITWNPTTEDIGTVTIVLQVADGKGGVDVQAYQLEINNPPQENFLTINDVTITEGDSETSLAEITVSLNAPSDNTITADYRTSDATATAGEDYTAKGGTIAFNPGDPLTQTLEIEILADTVSEAEETFNVILENPSNATLEKAAGIITIIDNDQLIGDDIILTENSNFRVSFTQPFNISNSNTILKFTYADLNFDPADPENVNDAFEAALIDSFGNSLVHTIGGGSNAYFNLTEGEPPPSFPPNEGDVGEVASGVTREGETVSLNLASVPPGTEATLILRLVNNDSDTETSVRITDIEIVPGDGTLPPGVTPEEPAFNNPSIDFEKLTDVSSSLQAEYFQTTYNENSQQLLAEIAIRNNGSYPADPPLLVAIDRISDPTVRVRNVAGFTPDGLPYYDLTHLVASGMLSPGEITATQTISFYNPRGVQFTYDLIILSELNAPPIIESQPPTEIIFGQTYDYQVIATDADEDTLTYEILSSPAGLTIDRESGLINWETIAEDIANHAVTVRVRDGRGGADLQTFTLSVIEQPPNRPPIFTSTPVVDAWINQLYIYDSEAVDPDQDPLGYTLILGPDGVTVHPTSGQVEWTPQPVLVIGDTVLGQLNLPGDSDEFSFSGVAGQWLYFDPLQYTGTQTDWNFSVYGPGGERLINTDFHNNNNQLLKLTESGTYQIVVDTAGDSIGNYGFSVIDLDLLPVTPFDTVIEGQLIPGSEDDVFRFAGSAGQKLFLDKISNSGSLDWVLYNATGNVITSNGNFDDIEYYLPIDGDYILALRGKAGFTNQVDYSFEIITPEEITTEMTLGSNDSPNIIEAEIGEKGEEDFYTFTGSAGQQIYWDRQLADLTNVRALTATIVSPSGQDVLSRNFYYGDDPEPITLKENGTYKVRLDTSNENTGTYSFSLLDFENATPIDLDTAISNTLDPGQQTHLYRLDLTAGQHLFFDTEGGTTNTNWSLYDEGTTRISHTNFNTDIETIIPMAGTYTLAIRGHNGPPPVDYRFQVITPDTNTLTLDTTVAGEISEKGEQDVYTFTGTEGQRIFLDVLEENVELQATLVSPSSTTVINATPMWRDYERHPLILPESGTYQLTIDGPLETTGNYSFRLADLTDSPLLEMETVTSGTLDPGTSIQFYQFEGNRGDRLYFSSQETSANSSWHLYSSNNTELRELPLSIDMEEVLLGDGTYYLMLRGDNGTPVDYAINLVRTFDEATALTPDIPINETIEKLGERDIYTFEGTIGQTLYFDAIEGDGNITFTLESPTSRLVTNGNTAGDSHLITLRESGTYQLTVDGNNDTTGDYSFQLLDAASSVSLGSPLTGDLTASETILYELTGTSGQQLDFESLEASANTSWILYAPGLLASGNTILKNVSLETDFTVTLPSDGTYTLALRSNSEDAGNYEFSVTDRSHPPETNSELGVYSGNIDAGEVDSYTFTATAGTLVFFNGQGDNWQLHSRLYHPDETPVYSNLDNLRDAGPYLLAQTGTYRLEAYGYHGSSVGNYSFQLLDLSTAPELTLNTDISVPLDALEAKAYKFTGEIGQKIWFDGLNETNPNVTASLYNPNGSLLSEGSLSNLQLDMGLLTLEADGIYYLVLSSNNSSATDANFRLLDDSEAEELELNTDILGDLGGSKRETFLYKLNGVAGERLYFNREVGDSGNYWELYGPEGNSIDLEGLHADFEVVLPGDGEYLLSVSGYGSNNVDYQFRVETSSPGIPEVPIGTPITGEISVAGERDTYTFEGTENQRLWFDSLATASEMTATLYSPGGETLFGYNVAIDREPTFLKETGTYRLVVDASGETTGTYNFRFLDLDTDARSVGLDTNIAGNFGTDDETFGRETHLYKFEGNEGQSLYFYRFDGDADNYYYLYSPNGELLFLQHFSSDYEGEAAILPNDGTYTLVFSGNDRPNNNYDLRLVTPELVSEPLAVGETVSGEISEAGEQDTYTFTGTVGQQVLFDSLEYSDSRIGVKILSPSGEEVFSRNVGSDSDPIVLTEEGIYRIVIDASADFTGSYQFRLLDFERAESISLDSEMSGDFGADGRDAKLYKFEGNEGEYLYFDSLDGDSANTYYFYDPNGQQLFEQRLNSDYEGPAAILPSDGEYRLVFYGNGAANNNYRLRIVTSEFVNSPEEMLGTTISGEIGEVGEQDTYTFEGRFGQQLWFDSLEYSDSRIRVKLLSPSGEQVFSQLVRDDGEPVVLEESGTYSIEIDASGDYTGTYSFRLLDLAEATLIEDGLVSGDFGSSKREAHVYRLAGGEGDYLYFESLWGDDANFYYFYDQYGRRLFSQHLARDAEWELPNTGDYTLVVAGLDGANNDYELSVVSPSQLTVPLRLNERVSSEIGLAGERDTYRFEGTVGQPLFFDAIVGDSQLRAKLYSPSEGVVIDSTMANDWSPFTLEETGSYRLVIDYNEQRTGDYSFTLSDRSLVPSLEFETPIAGTLNPGKSTQLYQLTGTAGQQLSFDLEATSWMGASWKLYDPENQVIASPPTNNPDLNATLPSSGLYTLAIAGTSSTPVDYSFTVTDKTSEPITPTELGVVESGTVNAGETVDYEFSANAGTPVFFDGQGSNSNIRVGLVDERGNTVFTNHQTPDDKGPLILPQTGTYTLQLSGANSTITGDYQFQLLELPADLTNVSDPLDFNQVISGTLESVETQVYSFWGRPGQQILFNGMIGNNVNAKLSSPNTHQIFFQGNYGSSDTGLYSLTQEGVYHLLIQGTQATPRDYSFQLLDFNSGVDLDLNVPVSGYLPNGQASTFYHFEGTAGEKLFFNSILGTTTNRWKLYDPGSREISNYRLGDDFELELPLSGNYTLYIEGGTSNSPVDYLFQVFTHEEDVTVVTPGTGESGNNDGSVGQFPVEIEVEDGNGGTDDQNYTITVRPDPTNAFPAITSTPVLRVGLNQTAYRYQLSVFDPDGDPLNYRLIESPLGAFINGDSGELLWFPSEDVAVGETYDFTVNVADGRGGEDTQTFSVEVFSSLGTIRGAVFEDLNNNGYRDTSLVLGDSPNIVFAIDTSGSTGGNFVDWTTADLETVVDSPMGILGMEIATAIALSEQLILQGRGETAQIGVVPFTGQARLLDMDPATPGIQLYTTPLADNDNNGITDLRQVLNSLAVGGSTYFTPALVAAEGLLDSIAGDPNLIFLSDGFGGVDTDVVQQLESDGVNITAFGIGAGAGMGQLRLIDPEAIQVTNPRELIEIFSGWDDRYATEPLMSNVSVYLDSNDNGELDEGEPIRLTQPDESLSLLGDTPFQFSFENLLPGTYTLRQVVPNGYRETTPEAGSFVDTIAVESGETFSHLFGNHFIAPVPNVAPEFTSSVPGEAIEVGELFKYQTTAFDPDADALSYELTLRPEGMGIDVDTGAIVWMPRANQVGRFNAIARVSDGRGGLDLQSISLEVLAANNSPVFVSSFPEDYQPQVGKLFEYQALALDGDGDELSYGLVESVDGVTIDEETGLVSGTLTELGTQELTISVSDGRGGEALQTLEFEVIEARENEAPVITSTPRTTAVVGSVYLSQLMVTDDVSGGLSFEVSGPSGMTIDEEGLISWTPTAGQLGNHEITVEVTDSEDAVSTIDFEISVSHRGVNKHPRITSVPETVTTIESPYLYELSATDPEGDYLVWSLESAPSGMAIDAVSGVLSWQPNPVNIGEHAIDVRVTDAGGLSAGQEFLLRVTGANTAPQIVSVPPTEAGVGEVYSYQAVATDLEKDGFGFSLIGSPSGMAVDEVTGVVSWTPLSIGSYEVDLRVTDELGASSSQVYTIEVGEQRVNNAPEITSNPVYLATPDVSYNYQVVATDVDGDDLRYELISGPSGMAIDELTGMVSWDSPAIGSHQVVVGVNDSSLGAAQGYSLTVRNNSLPEISFPSETEVAVPERLYRYDLQVTDAEGDALSFELVSGPQGMSIDEEGRIRWFPDNEDVGDYDVEVRVTDSFGGESTGSFSLRVTGDDQPPVVELLQGFNFVDTGQQQVLWVAATDNVGVTSLGLVVDDVPVAVSPDGVAEVSFDSPGEYRAIASAMDAAGNQGTATVTIEVLDPDDGDYPVVALDGLPDELVTNVIELTGTVTDDNLAGYQLEAAPIGTDDFVTIFSGTEPVTDGVLGEFDPTLLLNDTYTLRLTATDTGGNSSFVSETIDVGGDLKLGNFQMSFTDLEVPVSGIPISVTRTYDSLAVGTTDDFGPGWRLEFRDTDLRTSLGPDETFERFGIRENAFSNKTRVYITLPGGKRETFTFSPTPDRLNGFVTGPGGEGGWFHPSFTSQDGSFNTLTVEDVRLTRNPDGEYVGLNGVPYNPENPMFGGRYTLTTKEGIVYRIDAVSGDLLTVTDRNGNTLTFSDEGIFSDTGKQVTFQRDARGRIERIFDPMGREIVYDYDRLTGDLIGVTDREENTTTFEYEEPTRVHFLTGIDDPLGRDAVRNEYDESGRLKRILDVNGEAVELVYDPDNSTQTVKDVFGYETFYEYDERGNIVQEVDALGGIILRTYDDDNNLLSETNPEDETTTYTYDSRGNQLTITDPLGNIISLTYNNFNEPLTITDALGNTVAYTYDDRGNQTAIRTEETVLQRSADSRGQITTITGADGSITEFLYDSFGRVTRQLDALGNETQYTYDALGNLLSETKLVTINDATQALETRWTYDSEGRVTSTTNPAGHTTQFVHDILGNLVASIDPLGRRTEYRYDDSNRLIETIHPDGISTSTSYDAGGREIAKTDRLGRTTHLTYDALGRLTETILPDNTPNDLSDNPKLKTEYDKVGRITADIDPFGNRKDYEYDEAGRSILTRDALGNETSNTVNAISYLTAETDALNRTTHFFFDANGREIETRFADGTSESQTYNAAGLIDSIADRAGRRTYIVWDEIGRPLETIHPDETPDSLTDNPRTRREYDELSRLIAEIDASGLRTEYSYDALDRVISVSDGRGTTSYTYDAVGNRISETDALDLVTEFVYDDLNRLVETIYADGAKSQITYDAVGNAIAMTDRAGNTTNYEYDAQNRLTAVVDALDQRTEYFYDLVGNLIEIKDANNHSTFYEYDALNRRVATTLPWEQRSEMTYDAVGNLLTYTDFNGSTINYEYDLSDRLIAKGFEDSSQDITFSYTLAGLLETATDARGTTSYSYDARDQLLSRIDPDGRFIEYAYDIAGNRTVLTTPESTTRYVYDPFHRLSQVIDPDNGITSYTYDNVNNLISKDLPNGTTESREYDALNRLTFIEQSNSTDILASYRYTLDPVGNRTAIEELNERRTEYTYNALYQVETETIIDAQLGNSTTTYTYDPVGNRLSQNSSIQGLITYTYDENDRLLAATRGSEVTQYTYDNNGNVISQINPTDQITYQWDDENRLIQAEVANSEGTQQVSYQYNSEGIRVSSTVDGIETRYLVDPNRSHAVVLEEYQPEGELIASYVYGEDVYNYAHDLISQKRDGERSFYHADALGSIRLLTNVDGNVTDTYQYDAYGNAISSTGSTVNNYLYAGEQFDPVLKEYYLRARYYDPNIGRFISTDPFEGLLTDPLSLTKYPYVHGNPVNQTDPSGLLKFDTDVAAILHSILSRIPGVSPVGALRAATTVDSIVKIGWLQNLILTAGFGTAFVAAKFIARRNSMPILVHAAAKNPDPAYPEDRYLGEHAEHIRDTQMGLGNNKRRVDRLRAIHAGISPPLTEIEKSKERGEPISPFRVSPHAIYPGFYVPVRASVDGSRSFLDNVLRKNAQLGSLPKPVARDEFPFVSTTQGGTPQYHANRVSARYVPALESSRQGQLIGKFYNAPGVDLNLWKGDPLRGRFIVWAKPKVNEQSGYYRRDGIFVGVGFGPAP